jgi:Phage integrase family
VRAHRAAQAAERLKAGGAWRDNGPVFAQPHGRPLDKRADRREWRALLAEAGVRTIRLHDARHSAPTTLLALGVDVRVVADMLGHSQTRVTSDIYQHVLPAMARDAAEKLSAALWEAESTGHQDGTGTDSAEARPMANDQLRRVQKCHIRRSVTVVSCGPAQFTTIHQAVGRWFHELGTCRPARGDRDLLAVAGYPQ